MCLSQITWQHVAIHPNLPRHIQDSQSQILALACRSTFFNPFKLFTLRSDAEHHSGPRHQCHQSVEPLSHRAKKEQLKRFQRILPESQGQNPALTVVYVPNSLDASVADQVKALGALQPHLPPTLGALQPHLPPQTIILERASRQRRLLNKRFTATNIIKFCSKFRWEKLLLERII